MSYKMRNIVVLGSFCLLVSLVSGYFIFLHFPGKMKKVNKSITSLKKQISALDGIQDEYYKLEDMIKNQEKRLANLDKRIVPSVTPAATYNYLNNILNYSGLLEFDLLYTGTKDEKDFHYNMYSVKGEGNFDKIFKFVSYIEKGPEFYRINKINLKLVETKDKDSGKNQVVVPFEIELWALYADVDKLPKIHRTLDNVSVKYVSNPFYPNIYANIPANSDELLEVERAELKAVMPNKAMISDNQGKVHILQEGDRVYLGYCSKIKVEKNEVDFILNKGGIVEKFTLNLRFNESN